MAASIRLEDEVFADPRVEHLGSLAGYNRYEALGRLAHLWRMCTQRGIYIASEVWVTACLGERGVAAILTAELGERVEGGIRVKGTQGRIEWLQKLKSASKAGGAANAARHSGGLAIQKDRQVDSQKGSQVALGEKTEQPGGCHLATQNPATPEPKPSAPIPTLIPIPILEIQDTPPGGWTDQTPGKKPRRPKTADAEYSSGFVDFWRAYPRKVAKPEAAKAFAKINPGQELFTAILAAVRVQSLSHDWVKDGGRFIPHPATWLNGRRWEDELSPGGGAASLPPTPLQPGPSTAEQIAARIRAQAQQEAQNGTA